MGQRINKDGLEMLKKLESFSPTPYQEKGGTIAIGWGHNIQPGEAVPALITLEQGEEYLAKDLAWAEAAVNSYVKVPLNTNQFSALVSFVYNIGSGAFKNSTMLKRLNQADYDIANEFEKWIYDEGDVSEGLRDVRRPKEIELFKKFPTPDQEVKPAPIPVLTEPAPAPVLTNGKTFTPLGKFQLSDIWRGLVLAILTAPLTIIYETLQKGSLTFDWKMIGGVALAGGVSYVFKNLLTGSNGNILTNK